MVWHRDHSGIQWGISVVVRAVVSWQTGTTARVHCPGSTGSPDRWLAVSQTNGMLFRSTVFSWRDLGCICSVLNVFFAPTAYTNSNQGGSSNELYRNNLRGSREHPCMVQPRRTVKTSMVQRSIRCGVHSAPLFFHLLIHCRFYKYYNNR